MKAHIKKDFCSETVSIRVKQDDHNTSRFLKGTFEWVTVPRHEHVPEDVCIKIDKFEARELAKVIFEAAIEAQILPDLDRVKGELEATKRHLADLQKAFNKLLESA